MPLIVPDLNPTTNASSSDNSAPDNNAQEWMIKLMGKKITDSATNSEDNLSFSKQDLPKEHRIVEPGALLTRDFKPE
ncbi:MAG: hypothetical protein Q9168_008440, partial [Polycauliona sp. 1 TL-2023]